MLDRELHLPSARVVRHVDAAARSCNLALASADPPRSPSHLSQVRHVDAAEVSLDGLALDHAAVLEDAPPPTESAPAHRGPRVTAKCGTVTSPSLVI